MGYLHINNLHKDQSILEFKRVYALEKVHGTSAHLSYHKGTIRYFSGGEKHEKFVALFNEAELLAKFASFGDMTVTVFGEAYGGKQQGMSHTYGPSLHFIAFDVKIDDQWLVVPKAEKIVLDLGLEFVPYVEVDTTKEALTSARDADSIVAVRRGMGPGKKMEGVVLRPPFEVTLNNGERLITKFKREDFEERKTVPKVFDSEKQVILQQAEAIAEEWVTPMRLEHVIQHLTVDGVEPGIEQMRAIITEMQSDVAREGEGAFVPSKEATAAIGKRTALLFKQRLNASISH